MSYENPYLKAKPKTNPNQKSVDLRHVDRGKLVALWFDLCSKRETYKHEARTYPGLKESFKQASTLLFSEVCLFHYYNWVSTGLVVTVHLTRFGGQGRFTFRYDDPLNIIIDQKGILYDPNTTK